MRLQSFKLDVSLQKKAAGRFSAMVQDHTHEQNNACTKRDGGAVGLIENPAAFAGGW